MWSSFLCHLKITWLMFTSCTRRCAVSGSFSSSSKRSITQMKLSCLHINLYWRTTSRIRLTAGLVDRTAFAETSGIAQAFLNRHLCMQLADWVCIIPVDDEQVPKPIRFWSGSLCDQENNYSETERECFAVIRSVRMLRYYIERRHLTLYTDP